jgi:hypothetical protein
MIFLLDYQPLKKFTKEKGGINVYKLFINPLGSYLLAEAVTKENLAQMRASRWG